MATGRWPCVEVAVIVDGSAHRNAAGGATMPLDG